MIPKCTSWLGHKFEARYSTGLPPNLTIDQIEAIGLWLLSEGERQMTKSARTYERDICVRCGVTVEKKP